MSERLLRGALALALAGILIGGCTSDAPTEPASTAARPAVGTVTAGQPPTSAGAPVGQTAGAAAGDQVEAAVQLAGKAFSGQEADDVVSLLRNARGAVDEEQQFQGYLGAWQYMRLVYHQQGEKAEQKAAMDAVEQIAARYSRYQKELFRLDK